VGGGGGDWVGRGGGAVKENAVRVEASGDRGKEASDDGLLWVTLGAKRPQKESTYCGQSFFPAASRSQRKGRPRASNAVRPLVEGGGGGKTKKKKDVTVSSSLEGTLRKNRHRLF